MPDANAQSDRQGSPRKDASSRPGTSTQQDPGSPPSKKLPQEDIDKSCTRLHGTTRKTTELGPIVERRALTKDVEEASVRRLYEQSVAQHKRKLEEAEKKAHAMSGVTESKKIDETEVQEAVTRLYQRSMDQQRMTEKRLEERYAPPIKKNRLPSKEAQVEVSTRLCNTSSDKNRESKSKLYDKYVAEQAPKMAKRTAAQIKEAAERLYSTGKS